MTSADQVARLLALVPYLQHHPDAELEATAEVFGVTSRQLIADLNVLWYCGLPGGGPGDLIEIDMDAVTDVGRIRLSNADYLNRPMRFTPDEALSLVVALRTVRELAPASAAPGIESALQKLEQATGTTAATAKVAVAGGSAELRDLLALAIADAVMVRLEYTDAGQESSTPLVAPARLIVRDGYGYLQAWSQDRQAWRTYRLDRISAAQPTTQAAPSLPEPPEFGPGWLEQRPEAAEVTVRLRPEASWVAEYYPIRQLRRGNDWLEIDLLVADPGWLRSLLLRLGRAVISISPEQAGEAAAEAAAEALAAYPAG
jgi:Predicted transcriptional regulator